MPFTVDDVQYPQIQPSQAGPNDSAVWEDARIGGTLHLDTISEASGFRGDSIELQMQPAHSNVQTWNQPANYSWGPISNLVTDPSIGGFQGDTNWLGWSNGGVESNTVENFELDGRQGQFPMQPATGYGPVGFNDQSGILGASLAQDAYDFPTPYESGVSIVRNF